ncbi:MAG: hypothetical protein Q8P26_04620, partial [Candidatus Levybacteria bacterium]|nr:hypothetical protein [Candidatus Levybacteria bacterium]
MTEQQHRPSEVMQEEIMITPKALLEDNHSTNSEQLRKTWEENRRRGNLTVYFTCGDARIWTASPEESTSIRSIAAGGSKYPYSDLVNNRGVGQIVVLDHHDGDTAEPGQIPSGCGGLAAKEQFNGHQDKAEKGIAEYIKHEVKHPDVIVQALLTAEEIAMQTQKPVMAATQDHLTEEVFPIAVFSEGGLQKLTAIHLNDILGNLYN